MYVMYVFVRGPSQEANNEALQIPPVDNYKCPCFLKLINAKVNTILK